MVTVKNKKGTSNDKLPEGCKSWKEYWEKNNEKKWPKKCKVDKCKNDAEVGAHVYKTINSKIVYIVPICNEHNNYKETEEMSVDKDYLVEIKD